MRYLATLMMVKQGDDYKLLALSEQDSVFVVMDTDAPADLQDMGRKISQGTGMTPFAHICLLEPS